MDDRQERAVADRQAKMLAGLAAMRLTQWPIVRLHADTAIGFLGDLPGAVGAFERVAELSGSSTRQPNPGYESKGDTLKGAGHFWPL